MPVITPDKSQNSYDVIIVGSGAGGGQTAYTLTMDGVKVLMLEAGRFFTASESAMLQLPSHAPLRGVRTPDKQYGFHDCSINSGWNIPGEPYTNAEEKSKFRWWRQRMLGGRTNHWGRKSLRNGPYDFKPHTHFDAGFDWPISYDDVAPYYDKVEMLIGVFGSNEGIENSPDSSPGVLLPPPKLRVGELYAQKHAKTLGWPIIPTHRAVLTQAQDAIKIPAKLHPGNKKAQRILAQSMRLRAPCFWAPDCHRGCAIGANYDSHTVHLKPALATGNLDILPNAMAREVTIDKNGKASGITFIDKEAMLRFKKAFANLNHNQQTSICDDICDPVKAQPKYKKAVRFFKRFRDLTAGAYYTTPEGMKDIGYRGNIPQASFEGPPTEALRHVGLIE